MDYLQQSFPGQPVGRHCHQCLIYLPAAALSVVTFVGQGYVPSSNITIASAAYVSGVPAFVLSWNSTTGATYSVFKTNVLGGPIINWPAIVDRLSCRGSGRRPALVHGRHGHRQSGFLSCEQSVIWLEALNFN